MRESGKTHNCSISPRMLKMISSTRSKDEKEKLQRNFFSFYNKSCRMKFELLIEFKEKMHYFE
jgi:hypothetical protein